MKDILTLSVITFNAVWGQKESNLKRIIDYIEACSNKGSRLIIFPEMALTGYDDEEEKTFSEKMQFKLAETIPGPATDLISQAAKKWDAYVVVGMPERDQENSQRIYNSLAIFSPTGLIGSYRKIHLPHPEPHWATRGDKPFIFESPWGPIGCSICYDNYCFPELRRYYAAMGCRLSINSTALSEGKNKYGEITLEAGVLQDGIYIASANLGGKDLYSNFCGGSSVIGPGRPIFKDNFYQETKRIFYYAGKRFTEKDAIEARDYTTTVDLSLATRYPYIYNPEIDGTDWRPEIYQALLEQVINKSK